MDLYTVHAPDAAPDAVTRADRTHLVREGFSVPAFLFGPAFLAWHRVWVGVAAWFVVIAILVVLSVVLRLPPALLGVAVLLVQIGLGLEGGSLRRWTLGRQGYSVVDLVSGDDLEEAELAFFARAPALPPRPTGPWVPQPTPAIIGMFPDGAP